MDPEARDAAVAQFAAVTGADAATAAHVLDAHSWNADAAVAFFLDGGMGGGGGGAASAPAPRPPPLRDSPEIMAVEPGAAGGGRVEREGVEAAAGVRPRSPPRTAGPADRRGPSSDYVMVDDDDDEAVQVRAEAGGRGGRGREERDARPTLGTPPPPQIDSGDDDADDADDALAAVARRAARAGAAAAAAAAAAGAAARRRSGPGFGSPQPDLPADVNVEEARMLEAAMLGVPYEPPPHRRWVPPPPPTSAHLAARALRDEQDDAYEASLAEDRAKAESAAVAEAAARAAAERQAAEAAAADEASARAAADAQAAAADAEVTEAAAAAAAAAALPPEPAAGAPASISVAVRLPDGARLTRRFAASDPVASLYDFVVSARAPGAARGSFTLVSSFPRRALDPAAGSLAGAGLTHPSEALLVEPKK